MEAIALAMILFLALVFFNHILGSLIILIWGMLLITIAMSYLSEALWTIAEYLKEALIRLSHKS